MAGEETRFKAGNPGGPGRPPEAPPELKKYTKEELARSLCKLMRMSVKELAMFMSDQHISTLDMVVGCALKESMKKGDFWALDKMLERIIGKVPQKTEMTGADGVPFLPPVMNFNPVRPAVQESTAPDGN